MKLAIKTFMLVVMIFIGYVISSASPIISNDLAMTQMENSDALFAATQAYAYVMLFVKIAYYGVVVVFAGTIVRDIFKIYNNINKEN